jgi:hypothetical protein
MSAATCADNEEVVDHSEVVITAVRRQDRHEALAGLRVDPERPSGARPQTPDGLKITCARASGW